MSAYPYPPDEFDARAETGAPVGVHRARPTRWSQVWPYLAIALAALATVITLLLVTQRYGSDAGPAVVGGGEIVTGIPEDLAPVEVDPDTAAQLLADANLNAHIIVLNDRAPNGEAGRGQAALQAAGFTTVEAETATSPTEHQFTTVMFKPGYEATARAVATELNVPIHHMVEQDESAAGDIVVVLRSPLTSAE